MVGRSKGRRWFAGASFPCALVIVWSAHLAADDQPAPTLQFDPDVELFLSLITHNALRHPLEERRAQPKDPRVQPSLDKLDRELASSRDPRSGFRLWALVNAALFLEALENARNDAKLPVEAA